MGNATELHASFTIKGVTAPVSVTLTGSSTGDGSIQISGETTIDRSRFDIGWNKFGMIAPTAHAAAHVVFVRSDR